MSVSYFSSVQLFATLWTEACQAPLPMGFFRQEYWSELPCPPTAKSTMLRKKCGFVLPHISWNKLVYSLIIASSALFSIQKVETFYFKQTNWGVPSNTYLGRPNKHILICQQIIQSGNLKIKFSGVDSPQETQENQHSSETTMPKYDCL